MAYQGTLTMAEHRKDKALYMLQVRAKRNATRAALKREHKNSQLDGKSVFATASALMFQLFDLAKSHLMMEAPSNKQRAINAWFDYYGHALSNFDGFKTLLLSQQDNSELSDNTMLNMQLNSLFSTCNSELMTAMQHKGFVSQSVIKWHAAVASRKMVAKMPTAQKNNALLALMSA
jgi:hypothetical protein